MAKARLAVDIGGTFTDAVVEREDGVRTTSKILTTPKAPEKGFLAAVDEALAKAGLAPGDIGVIIHGTTLATNALIERRGAKTALLTTEGHRDALEMAYENRFEQYDINIDRPKPLVPRWLRLPVRERMNFEGRVLVPLDEASLAAHLKILDEEAVESVAIGFLHAYANPHHEARARDLLAGARPNLSITLACEVAPEIREFERLSTAVANAYVRPLMEAYLRALERDLRARGFNAALLLMTSGGGLTTLDTAARFPIRLVESGPAGGAVLAAALARDLEIDALLSFDMGGTTAKLCLIDKGVPETARAFEVDRSYRFKKGSGLPVRIPVVEMVEIGAGGGSIAYVDAYGRLQVGPESAGSEPGPAAYGRGAKRATVTDADVALARVTPERFAGGSIALDLAAARRALADDIGGPLGFETDIAAFALAETVDENMAAAARAHAVEGGKDISARAMVAFGGAAPLHAARLAEKLGVARIIIPADAGVGSAVGFLLAPASYELVRSRPMRLAAFDERTVARLYEEMRGEAEAVLRPAVGDAPLEERRSVFMRYLGQGHEIPVAIEGEATSTKLLTAFETQYAELYGRTIPDMEIEALTFALSLSGPRPEHALLLAVANTRARTAETTREVFDAGAERRLAHGVFERAMLRPGDTLEGPALIVEDQTTTLVSSAFAARIDAAGHIVLERKTPWPLV